MNRTLVRCFTVSGGLLLIATAGAKIFSSFGHAKILGYPDPVFLMPFRYVFFMAGAIEITAGLVAVLSSRAWLRIGAITWTAGVLALYRLGLTLVRYDKPCSCLGTVTDLLHIPPQSADVVLRIILGYLLLGGIVCSLWQWRQDSRRSPSPPATLKESLTTHP